MSRGLFGESNTKNAPGKKKMVQTGIRQYYYTSKKAWSLLKVGLLDSSLVPLSVPFCLNRLLCMC